MNNFIAGLFTFTGIGVFAGIAIIFGWFWQGYVFAQLWAWFIAPTFGLPTLQYAIAVGIIVTWRFLSASNAKQEEETSKWLWIFLHPLVFLGIGWVVTLFL